MTVLVLLLRRHEHELTPDEKFPIVSAFSGEGVRFQRIDPIDYEHHASICRGLNPAAIILPCERPIPSKAMEEGFPHLTVVDGKVMRLLPLAPQFEPFKKEGDA